MGVEGDEQHDGTAVGQYVTVTASDGGPRRVMVLVAQDAGSVVLRSNRPAAEDWRVGDSVQCRSVIGTWSATVMQADGDHLRLRLPDWVARIAQRRHRRVPSGVAVEIVLDGSQRAGRLIDISLGGACVLVERVISMRAGRELTVRVPPGEVSARIVNARAHANAHLTYLGLTWLRFELGSAAWIGQQVAAGAASLRSRPAAPTSPLDGDSE